MSETDELRRLLDERGVKWWPMRNNGYYEDRDTEFVANGKKHTAHEWGDGFAVYNLTPEQAIAATLGTEINGETSDGYHTFDELYHYRAVLFSVIVAHNRGMAWKARKHHDGTMCDGMFIVGIDTPWGQASYHYDIDPYWDMFDCMEREAAPEWDGHTPDEAIERIGKLATLGSGECVFEINTDATAIRCSSCGYSLPKGTDLGETRFCGGCRKAVKR